MGLRFSLDSGNRSGRLIAGKPTYSSLDQRISIREAVIANERIARK